MSVVTLALWLFMIEPCGGQSSQDLPPFVIPLERLPDQVKNQIIAAETTVNQLGTWNCSATGIFVKAQGAMIFKELGFSHMILIFIIFIKFTSVLAALEPAGKFKFVRNHTLRDTSII